MGRGGRGDGYGGWGWGGWGGAEGAQWQHPGGQVGADDERQCADGIRWITTTLIRLGDIYPCDIYPWRHIPIMGDIYPSWVNVSWVG